MSLLREATFSTAWLASLISSDIVLTCVIAEDKLDSLLTTKLFISSACWADCSDALATSSAVALISFIAVTTLSIS